MIRAVMFGLIGLVAACSPAPSGQLGEAAAPVVAAAPVSSTPAPAPGSCSAQIGEAAAQRLVDQCIAVSPATHPPCNVANSCAMIRGEITRSCALFAGSDPLPADLCPPAASPAVRATPAEVIADYYDAIDQHDYARAFRLWRGEGKASGKTLEGFAAGFAKTATVEVEIGKPSPPEGAAGSSYVTVPVVVRANTTDGVRQTFTGDYVLRRVNDVPGATAQQLAWRIQSASLKAAP